MWFTILCAQLRFNVFSFPLEAAALEALAMPGSFHKKMQGERNGKPAKDPGQRFPLSAMSCHHKTRGDSNLSVLAKLWQYVSKCASYYNQHLPTGQWRPSVDSSYSKS